MSEQTTSIQVVLRGDAVQSRIKEILGERAAQFSSSIVGLVNSSPQLKSCEPGSTIASCMTAALLDLPISKDLGFAWVVPYKGRAQFQMGYKGFIQLAMRTGQYERMNAEAVNAEAYAGRDEVGEPIVDWSKYDPLKPAHGYVFAFRLTNGFRKVIYWTKEQCMAHAKKYSQAFRSDRDDTPWKTNVDAMCLKTVVKHGLSKWGILSIELQKALREDQGVRSSPSDDFAAPPEYIDTTGTCQAIVEESKTVAADVLSAPPKE
jgi:recombination protein RecT